MFQYHNNKLCIQSSALYNKPMCDEIALLERKTKESLTQGLQDEFMIYMQELKVLKIQYKISEDTFLKKYDYKNYLKAEKINKLTTGGNGRTALIEYDSLGADLMDKIESRIGYNPKETQKDKTFSDSIGFDKYAEQFFKDYEKSDGSKLSEKQISQYIERTNIFNAITVLLNERESSRSAFGKGKTTLWKNIAKVIAKLPSHHLHKLPKHHTRLQDPYNRYIKNNYVGLLHKGLENDNSSKIKDEIADWWLAMYCQPNKMVVPIIMMRYNTIRQEREWPSLTEQAINSWLSTPEVKRVWFLARHGKEEYDNKFKHTIKRAKDNWFPNAYWAIDGSKIDWLHYEDTLTGMAARLKIDPVVDIYSEKIIGWSFSETENHVDHFNAVKMAVRNAGAKPYLFTYDNQSGHKSSKMQELYGKLTSQKGAVHYPNKAYAHNSPVEDIFRRLQQQVLNLLWFSDKQSPTVRTLDNKPNWDFIKAQKHLLKSKEDLMKAWEMCVKLWNDAPHPKFKNKSRSEVFAEEAAIREEVSFLDQVDLFWIYNNRQNTYRREGLKFTVSNRSYDYEVLDADDNIDVEFRRKYVGAKFIVKYDPDHLLDFIQLYTKDAQDNLVFVANAQPKREHESIPVLMNEDDKDNWERDYEVRDMEYQRDLAAIKRLRERTGITPEKLIADQELMIKMGGILTKEQRLESESEMVYVDINKRL